MEIRYFNQDDNLLDISNIYEGSWKFAYKGIIPQIIPTVFPKVSGQTA